MRRYYQIAIWMPTALPAACWLGLSAFGMPAWDPLALSLALLVVSGMYGGIPYALLASWATWRVRSLDETAIRRLAVRAPLLMLIAYLPYALIVGAFGHELWQGGLSLFAVGAVYIIVLGYGYVGATLLGRRLYRGWAQSRIPVQAV